MPGERTAGADARGLRTNDDEHAHRARPWASWCSVTGPAASAGPTTCTPCGTQRWPPGGRWCSSTSRGGSPDAGWGLRPRPSTAPGVRSSTLPRRRRRGSARRRRPQRRGPGRLPHRGGRRGGCRRRALLPAAPSGPPGAFAGGRARPARRCRHPRARHPGAHRPVRRSSRGRGGPAGREHGGRRHRDPLARGVGDTGGRSRRRPADHPRHRGPPPECPPGGNDRRRGGVDRPVRAATRKGIPCSSSTPQPPTGPG